MILRRSSYVVALLAASGLASAPAAGAHSLVRPAGAVVNYLSADATSLNTVVVALSGGRVVFTDRTVDGGMDPGSCTPGDVDATGYITSTSCPAGGVGRVRVDLGEREDRATVTAPIPTTLLGGPGADRLTGGPRGDALDGGAGGDRLAGGGGDDELTSADGVADVVACGEGRDVVRADTLDEVAADCEQVQREAVPAPPGGAGAGDRTAPTLRATAPRTQSVASRRTVRLVVASSEEGGVAASGVLDVDDTSLPVEVGRKAIDVAGGGVELRLSLSRAEHRRVLRALRRGRRARVRLTVVATDNAGNSRERKLPSISLTR